MNSELLTNDERLVHLKRWQGETRSLPDAIRALAKTHGLANDEVIDESEKWLDFVEELALVIGQLSKGGEK